MAYSQEQYAEKIAKLLRKAESTTPEEAEALVTKAQELMTQYAIDEALIAKARGENLAQREQLVVEDITFTGVYRHFVSKIVSTIAVYNDCRVVVSDNTYRKPHTYTVMVHGFESDVARVKLLDASVQIQCVSALTAWWKDRETSWMSAMQKFKERRQFIIGYSGGLATVLQRGMDAGLAAAARAEAERSNVPEAEASNTVSLAVRERKDQVKDWFDEKWGGSLRYTHSRYSSGSLGAGQAGRAAGERADVSTRSGVGGSGRRSLPS